MIFRHILLPCTYVLSLGGFVRNADTMLWQNELPNLQLRVRDGTPRHPRIGRTIQSAVEDVLAPIPAKRRV